MLLDLLLVNPNNRILSPFAAVEPPLWAGLIAQYQRQQGYSVKILDAEAADFDLDTTIRIIKAVKPMQVLIVVMGNNPSVSSTPKMIVTKQLIDKLAGKVPIGVTGLHPLALFNQTVKELGVPVTTTPVQDSMPDIPFDLLPMSRYRAHNWHCLDGSTRSPYASVYTSLGCPFRCSFCNIHALYNGQHKIWYRDPKDVAKEILLLTTKYKVRNIKFWDELFTFNREHILDICSELIMTKPHDLNIWAYARVDSVDQEMLNIMKFAGINWLGYGIETATTDAFCSINKKIGPGKIRAAIKMTHEAGIHVNGNFLFGLGCDEETLEFAKSLNLEYANFYDVKDYPGSKLYQDNTDWASYDQFGSSNGSFRDRAFVEFFSDLSYLANIHAKFGNQGVKQIENMLAFGKPKSRGAYGIQDKAKV